MIAVPAVDRPVHDRLVLECGVGHVEIETAGLFGKALRMIAGLPAVERCEATFRVATEEAETRWCRRYRSGDRWMRCDTTVRSTPIGFVEQRGSVALWFALTGPGQAALYSTRFFGMPLPRRLLSSRVESVPLYAGAIGDGLRTTVTIALGTGRLGQLRYTAELEAVR